MSRPVNSFLNTLFGSADGADCYIRFQAVARDAGKDASPVNIGDPLPAHQLILRGGSERFRAHIERWVPLGPRPDDEQGNAAKRRCVEKPACENASSVEQGPSLVGLPSIDASSRSELPELLVPLDSGDELQPSVAAIRFMYTGSVFHQAEAQPRQQHARQGQAQQLEDGTLPVGELLLIRRQAEYLQVQGCAEACDAALEECFKRSPVSSSSSSSTASPLAPVLEMYNLQHLLPSEDEEPRIKLLLTACRKRLVQHWEAQLPESPKGTARASRAKILAWLLGGGDAVRIANDPQLTSAWLQLPAAALEELLQFRYLSTDDEATVVLLVEMWVAAQGSAVTEADKARVRGQLRLVNCNTAYLFNVLPKLPWLGPDPGQQAAFMARCRLSDRPQWRQHGLALGGYDTSTPWYSRPRPQSVPEEGVSYRWEVSREDLLAGLRREGDWKHAVARFQGASTHSGDGSRVVALGFEWKVWIEFKRGNAHAGLYLFCYAPKAIEAQAGKLQGGCNVSVRLEVRGDGAVGRACKPVALKDEVVPFGSGRGQTALLPLEQGAGGQAAGGGEKTEAELLAPWAKLLGSEGKIRGVLTFARPAV